MVELKIEPGDTLLLTTPPQSAPLTERQLEEVRQKVKDRIGADVVILYGMTPVAVVKKSPIATMGDPAGMPNPPRGREFI